MKILAVETSCDETAVALIEASGGLHNPKFKILKNLVASQIKIHAPYGGVVPNLAKREHLRNLPLLWQRIMNYELRIKNNNKKTTIHNSKFIIPKIDLICVTVGPGLEPALWVGINFARDLHRKLATNNKRPTTKLLGVSHLDGHLYSSLLNLKSRILYPAVSLIVSGGHTNLLLMKDLSHYKKLGETRDDAVGESFDKVARLLNLSYPGGPEIEKSAKKGDSGGINFPRPMINQKNYDFSFSGLKTAVLYYLRDNKNAEKADVAASFQKAAFDVLINKTIRAVKEFKAKSITISGGVAANKTLKRELAREIKKQFPKNRTELLVTKFPTDNAVMIGTAGYINLLRKKNYKLEAQGNLGL